MTKLDAKRTGRALCTALCMVSGCTQEAPESTPVATPPPVIAPPDTQAPPAAPPTTQAPTQPPVMAPVTTPSAPVDQPMTPALGAAGAAAVTPPVANAPEPTWEPLITASWQLGPGEERYFCQRVTLTEDIYFSGIRALNPLGTHHTALTAEPVAASAPDGLTECASDLNPQGIFGSGVGTNPMMYPPGVGLRLRAGQQLLLNLHVFNVSAEPLSGTSGTEIVRTTADAVQQMAESLLAGPTRLNLPAHMQTTVSGTCTMTQDTTLFAVQPHMHQLGIHMKGVAESSMAGTVVLHDGPYAFDTQVVYPIEPVQMRAGDTVHVECTFDNTTDRSVGLGESSTAEMCFMVLHRYPAAANPSVTCFF